MLEKQLIEISDELIAIAKNIRLLVLDVDGVLTDGSLFFTILGESMKVFHIHDGLGIKMLLQNGFMVAIITGRTVEATMKRLQELGVDEEYVYQGIDDKLTILDEIVAKLQLDYTQVAYMGDDLPDLPCVQKVGLGIAVNDAVQELRQEARLVTKTAGGRGAVREVCDLLLLAAK